MGGPVVSSSNTAGVQYSSIGGTFAQAEQAGHVIDLRVHQHHGPDGAVAQPAPRVQRRAAADLMAEVG
jgi:hypothetical protein